MPWTPVDSRSALLNAIADEGPTSELVTADANEWGFFRLPNDKILVVGYADLGLLPMAVMLDNHLLVGIDEILACLDVNTLERKFFYRMPSVFHEFISLADPIIVRDEVGFVALSGNGNERWKFLTSGPINKSYVEGRRLYGETIDDEQFEFLIPS